MERTATRFARRILLVHLLLLGGVVAVVVVATREIYYTTRAQVIKDAGTPQALLAAQTADGIESYYKSIRNDMDLLRHANSDDDADAQAPPATTGAAERAGPRGGDRVGPGASPFRWFGPMRPLGKPPAGPAYVANAADGVVGAMQQRTTMNLVGSVLWKQLQGRVSHLFLVEGQRLYEQEQRLERGKQLDRRQLAGVIHSIDAPNEPPPENSLEILRQKTAWIHDVERPSVSTYVPSTQPGERGGLNFVCVPLAEGNRGGRRMLIADVPLRRISEQFLDKLNDRRVVALLLDSKQTTMAASDPALVGKGVNQALEPAIRQVAGDWIARGTRHTVAVERKPSTGQALRDPRIVTIEPVVVMDKRWTLIISSPLADVEQGVDALFRKALGWAVLVGASMAAILFSTSLQLIRGRARLERARHEMLAKELSQARQIQLAWLPDPKRRFARADIAAVNHPASHISGDFYNWFDLPDGRLVVTIGDVTGHGMSAAFLMATTQLLVRTTMTRLGDPGACLGEVNRQLCSQIFNGQFVTMLVLVLDWERNEIAAATAGHYPPLLSDGESYQPMPIEPQLVLGVQADETFTTQRFPLPALGSLLLYTDGVLDVLSPSGARFDPEGLQRTLYGRFDAAQKMIDALTGAIDLFRGPRALPDDLTVVAIQFRAAAPVAPSAPGKRSPSTRLRPESSGVKDT